MSFILSSIRRTTQVGVTTLAAAGACVGAAQAATVHGTVVHRNARAQSFVVADSAGHLYAIHARRRPRPGTIVTVSVRRLRNGTYAARALRVGAYHRRARVRLRGVVSYIDRQNGTFTLSARGVSMVVAARGTSAIVHGPASFRTAAIATDALPAVGSVVTATGSVDDQGDLTDASVQTTGMDTGAVDIEGTVLAVDTAASTITVSSSDDDQASGSIVVNVPPTLDISLFSVGQEVELTVAVQPDGSYLLTGSSSDQGQQGADDQGDQQGDQGDQGDQQGDQGDQAGQQGDQGAGSGSYTSDGGSTTGSDSATAGTGGTTSASGSTGSSDGGPTAGD
ncbi:MAG TPA: hypothetical protein VKV27_12345 [Solirubrobacteraceae bacterium]|nr:hypothetical protein [Solirubrobacteraceae bacterium]